MECFKDIKLVEVLVLHVSIVTEVEDATEHVLGWQDVELSNTNDERVDKHCIGREVQVEQRE